MTVVEYFHAPWEYLTRHVGYDPREFESINEYSCGPSLVHEERFVCPDCQTDDAVKLEAMLRSDGGEATISCQHCEWSKTQTVAFETDDADGVDDAHRDRRPDADARQKRAGEQEHRWRRGGR